MKLKFLKMCVSLSLQKCVIVYIVLEYVVKVQSANFLWAREPTFDNRTTSFGQNVSSLSKVDCCRVCSVTEFCSSCIFIANQDFNCQLLDRNLTASDDLIISQNTIYYVIVSSELPASPTSSISTTASTSTTSTSLATPFDVTFTCPPDYEAFRTVLLEDNKVFTYKVMKIRLTQQDAMIKCALENSYLTRVTTFAKMNFLLHLLRTCPGYNIPNEDYYVDGRNFDASSYTAEGAWQMVNGDPVPMSEEYWSDDAPDDPHLQHCIRMTFDKLYKFDDCRCDTMLYFICER